MGLLSAARTPPVVGSRDMTVTQACAIMIKEGVAAVAVVEDGKLAGIFTERDLAKTIIPKKMDPETTKLGDVMTTSLKTVTSDKEFDEALAFMLSNKIRHLPIVDADNHCLGMLSLRSMLLRHCEDQDSALDSITAFMGADGPGG
jgi:CBS domain-containing protein